MLCNITHHDGDRCECVARPVYGQCCNTLFIVKVGIRRISDFWNMSCPGHLQLSQLIVKYEEWCNFLSNEPLLCSCNNLVTKQLYRDIKLKQEPDTALSLTQNGPSVD